jgi:predicted kinase
MRDRLQGRKKKAAAPSDQKAPPPLQPAYFEAEQAPDTVSDESGGEPEAASPPEQDRSFSEDRTKNRSEDRSRGSDAPEAPSPQEVTSEFQPPVQTARVSSTRDGRGRRRRGGRGRGGRGREQAVAQAFAPAAVKGSITAEPAEPLESEASGGSESQEEPVAVAATTPKSPTFPAAPQRPPKGVVVLAIGLPGSGKSSWFKRHNVTPLSSDLVRTLLFDDVREQRFQDLVFSNLRSMLKARLIAKRPMNYVDATNLTPQERQHWVKLAKEYQYEVHAVFFDVPLEVCIERHERRDRVVPEDVMRRMAAKLKPPAFDEGFAKITVVRVKKKEAEAEPEVNAS